MATLHDFNQARDMRDVRASYQAALVAQYKFHAMLDNLTFISDEQFREAESAASDTRAAFDRMLQDTIGLSLAQMGELM